MRMILVLNHRYLPFEIQKKKLKFKRVYLKKFFEELVVFLMILWTTQITTFHRFIHQKMRYNLVLNCKIDQAFYWSTNLNKNLTIKSKKSITITQEMKSKQKKKMNQLTSKVKQLKWIPLVLTANTILL